MPDGGVRGVRTRALGKKRKRQRQRVYYNESTFIYCLGNIDFIHRGLKNRLNNPRDKCACFQILFFERFFEVESLNLSNPNVAL